MELDAELDIHEEPNLQPLFDKYTSIFDIPMLVDGNDDYYGKPEVQNMPVADAVLSILMGQNEEGCKLQKFCKKSGITCYDNNRCKNSPWENFMADELCPVAVYFKGYGVDGKKYKWRMMDN